MNIDFTPWLIANYLIVAFLLGFGWSAGCWLWSVITTGFARKG